MAGRADKRASNDSTQVRIPELKIFSLHPPAKIREKDIRGHQTLILSSIYCNSCIVIVVLCNSWEP